MYDLGDIVIAWLLIIILDNHDFNWLIIQLLHLDPYLHLSQGRSPAWLILRLGLFLSLRLTCTWCARGELLKLSYLKINYKRKGFARLKSRKIWIELNWKSCSRAIKERFTPIGKKFLFWELYWVDCMKSF